MQPGSPRCVSEPIDINTPGKSFDAFFDLRLNKRWSKQYETPEIWEAIAPIMTSQ